MNTDTTDTNTKPRNVGAILVLALVVAAAICAGLFLARDASASIGASPIPMMMDAGKSKSFACCEDVDDISSCYPADPVTLTTCDAGDAPAFCTWEPSPVATFCYPLAVKCCENAHGLTWVNTCWEHGPGDICDGTVITQPI